MTEQLALDFGAPLARSAVLSSDGVYRYRLDRRWSDAAGVTWIMLNPSTADAQVDDATLRRVAAFSKSWGFGCLTVVNLYALRATDPRELWTAADPIGPDNDQHLREACTGRVLVAAWGAHARPDRIAAVLGLLATVPGTSRLHALAVTGSGQPKHPLYLRGDLTMRPWEPPRAAA